MASKPAQHSKPKDQKPQINFLVVPIDPKKRKESYLQHISNGSDPQEEYWSWKNMVRKQLKEGSAQNCIPKVPQLHQCRSENEQSGCSKDSVDDNGQNHNKHPTQELKWSKAKSLKKKPSQNQSEIAMCRKGFLINAMEQTFQKMGATINVRIKDNWKVCNGVLKQGRIMFLSQHYSIDQITKLKLLPDAITKSNYRALKFVYHEDAILIGLSMQPIFQKYTIHLAWFAGILMCKILHGNLIHELDCHFSSDPKKGKTSSKFSGLIYKKSQYLGIWCERWLTIKQDGIYTYDLEGSPEQISFLIAKGSIKYIWTRFETYNNCIIIKIKHNLRQTQLAFPISDIIERKFDWLTDIYDLMMFSQ